MGTYALKARIVSVDLRPILLVNRTRPDVVVLVQARGEQLVLERVRALQDGWSGAQIEQMLLVGKRTAKTAYPMDIRVRFGKCSFCVCAACTDS